MIRLRSPFAVLLAALIFVSTASAQEKIELRLRLEKGQTFDQVIAMEQKVSQVSADQRYDSFVTTRFGIRNEVLDVDTAGNASVKVTYNYATLDMKLNGTQVAQYDSRRPPKVIPQTVVVVAALIGQSLTTTVSPRGEVIKIEGGEAIAKRMLDSLNLPPATLAKLTETVSESFKTQSGQSSHFTPLPEATVGIGDTWNDTRAQSALAPILFFPQYTLLSRRNGVSTIAMRSSLKTNPSSNSLNPDEYTDLSMSGNQSGTLRLNEISGLTQNFEIHQRVLARITMKTEEPDVPKSKVVIVTPQTKTITKLRSWPIYTKTTIRGWTIAPR